MPVSPLLALSPLDGRYAAKVESLRPLLSEYGLIRRRLQVEVEWFIALSGARFTELRPFGPESVAFLRRLVDAFSEADAEEIKAIERTTNHDVKAVEYWLAERIAQNAPLSNFAVMHALPRIADMGQDDGLFAESLMAAIAQGDEGAKTRMRDFLEGKAGKVKKQ